MDQSNEAPTPCVEMSIRSTRTRFEWFDAAGNLLQTDEVEGDGTGFMLDTTTGAVRSTGVRAPEGTAHVVTRPVVYTKEGE